MSLEINNFYEFGPFRLDPSGCVLWAGGQVVPLEPKVVETLLVLVTARGQVVSKAALIDRVWGKISLLNENAVPRNIHVLRRELGRFLNGRDCIETLPTRGYRFTLEVTERSKDLVKTAPDNLSQLRECFQQGEGARVHIVTNREAPRLGSSDVRSTSGQVETSISEASSAGRNNYRWVLACIFVALSVGAVLIIRVQFLRTAVSVPSVINHTQLSHDNREKAAALFTDGESVFLEENVGDRPLIARVPVTGGPTVNIPTPFRSPHLVSITGKGTSLVVADSHDSETAMLWELPLKGGPLHKLGNLHSFHVSFSPDDKRLAMTSGDSSALMVAERDGTNPQTIFSVTRGYIHTPRWSPDGRAISFAKFDPEGSQGTGASSVWTVSANGSNPRDISNEESLAISSGAWTPDAKHFVFDALRSGKEDIWVINSENLLPKPGTAMIRLTTGSLDFYSPLPNRDGDKVFALGKQKHGQLVRYDRKTRQFVPYSLDISASQINFSKDGKWITYIAYPEATLWRSRVDGSDQLQLTSAPAVADSPHWSPDGQRIAYRAAVPGSPERKIFLISKDGGAQEELTPGTHVEEGVPTWSSDGASLVFGELRYHPDKIGVHIMNLATKQMVTLPNSRGLWSPRWSPDGHRLLALIADANGFTSRGIRLYDFAKKKWKDLVRQSVAEAEWSYDGNDILFDFEGRRPESVAIFRVNLRNAKMERVVDLRDFQHASQASTGFSLMPDGSVLLLKEARQAEIYSLDVRWR